MRLASKAALLLSPDLRKMARELREARDLLKEAHANLVGQGAVIPSQLPNAFERVTNALADLEGRSQPGLTDP